MLTHQQVKFDWTSTHHIAFLSLKEAITQASILHYPDPNKKYIVYTDASDNACRAQLSQEHNGMEFPIAFLSHTFTETQRSVPILIVCLIVIPVLTSTSTLMDLWFELSVCSANSCC